MNQVFEWRNAPQADFAVIGDPIGHSLSPRMHQASFWSIGYPGQYVAVHVKPGEVLAAFDHLRSLGYVGVNVTVPHKLEAFRACEQVTDFAKRVRAVNTIDLQKRLGTNTDGPGFMETLPRPVRTALILGAGGSAWSIVLALAEAGVKVKIHNRTVARAEDLIAGLAHENAGLADSNDLTGFGLIVNTTSTGLSGSRLELDWSATEPGALAYDLVYGEELTAFLREATAAGLTTLDGRDLLVAQGALAFEFWTGQTADRVAMTKALLPMSTQIKSAAMSIREGKLVVMPTETVYGLAANAFDEQAVNQTFELKGRPNDNPLIVHINDHAMLDQLGQNIPVYAVRLAEALWPGPLTLVVEKRSVVPSAVTGGKETVAIRMPSHPLALSLIEEAQVPITAPSANPFMQISPTRYADIDPSIVRGVAAVLDGGPCEVGLESTVVDCTQSAPRILRPGKVTPQEVARISGVEVMLAETGERISPGLYARHYAPVTPVILVDTIAPEATGITFDVPHNLKQIRMSRDPEVFGRELYATLKSLDRLKAPEIQIERPPMTEEWTAIWDRLRKASTPELGG